MLYRWSVNILRDCQYMSSRLDLTIGKYFFFDAAVTSRETLVTRSRLSWCSSNSARKCSNMGRKGDVVSAVEETAGLEPSMSARDRLRLIGDVTD